MTSSKKAIEVAHLTFGYTDEHVLENVSFSLEEKNCLGVIGPNGGGKTTLLKLLLGLLKPYSGKITILGHAPEEMRHEIGYVPQALRFDRAFPLTVLDLVLMGRLKYLPWHGNYCHEDYISAKLAIARVGLGRFENACFCSLSGGQAQRALIARALASSPKLLLLDEPTASIDPEGEEAIYQLLSELKKDLAILIVTHDLKTAIHHVDRVLCVQKTASLYSPQDICEHFAFGLYHPPLIPKAAQ